MVHSVLAYGTGEVDAYNADKPIIVGHNVFRDLIDARWTLTGTQSGTDVTQMSNPPRAAWDGRGTRRTNFLGTSNTIYFNVQIPPSIIDTVCIIFAASFPSSTVTVQIADDGAFSTNVVDFAGPFTTASGCRLVRSFAGSRRQGVEFVRIRFVADSGDYTTSIAPAIVECFIGRGYAIGVWWGFGSDAAPSRSHAINFDSPQGHQSRYLQHHGRHVARHAQVLTTQLAPIDDVASIRAVTNDSRDFTRPVLYLPRPASELTRAMLGFPPRDGLNMPQTEFGSYDFSFDFDEQPPFYDLETCTAIPSSVALLTLVRAFYGPHAVPTGAGVSDDFWGTLEPMTATVGASNTPALATTSQAGGVPRLEITGTTAEGGFRSSTADAVVGLVGSGTVGGFDIVARFTLVTDPGGFRCLVGLHETAGGLFGINTTEPGSLTSLEFVAVGFPSTDSASADWHLFHSSGGGSVTDIDTNVPRNTTSVFELRLRSDRGSGSVRVDLRDLVSGGPTYTNTISTNLPGGSTPLYFATSHRHPSNNSVGVALAGVWMF